MLSAHLNIHCFFSRNRAIKKKVKLSSVFPPVLAHKTAAQMEENSNSEKSTAYDQSAGKQPKVTTEDCLSFYSIPT